MSTSKQPPTTLPDLRLAAAPNYPPHHFPILPSTAASSTPASTSTASVVREYRRSNWTLQETLTLIAAKKLDQNRRIKPTSTASSSAAARHPYSHSGPSGGGELRWKWVENYCYAHGCLRSQNQCNDKWDNLYRDYKKVRDHESMSQPSTADRHHLPSYWTMEKHHRKERGLPPNFSRELYDAINDVVLQRGASAGPQPSSSPSTPSPGTSVVRQLPPPLPQPPPPVSETTADSPETDDPSEKPDNTENKKRKKARNIGSRIVRGASVLARTLRSCEEKKEKRHREVMEVEHRRLRIEEHRNEISREGIDALVAAVNNLSGAIQSLISSHRN